MIFGKHINRYYLKYLPMLLLGAAALLLVDFMQLEIPELYSLVIDGMEDGIIKVGNEEITFSLNYLLGQICAPMLFIILCMVFGRFLWRVCFFGAGIKLETDLRSKMFDRCKDLSQQYYQVNKVGNLMSLFTNDLDTVQECFGWGIMMFFDALLLGIMSLVKMFSMRIELALLSLIPMILLVACSLIVGRYMSKKWEKRQEAFSLLSDFSQETFAGIAVVKAFVKEAHELLEFKKLCKNNEDKNVEYTKLSVLLNVCLTLFIESVVCVILGFGGYLALTSPDFNASDLVEFIGYFSTIIWPFMAVSELIGMNAQGKASLKRISELLDAEPDVIDNSQVEDFTVTRGDIEFKNLTFCYPDGEFNVLSDVSFSINAGENVGIIGRTGSGKTTIVDLILRTYNVPDGTVFIDGKDVNSIPIKAVRAAAAYVPQDNFLFSDTIENNISFATDGGNHDDVEYAAKLADVHDNIAEFPDQYGSVLGERGVTVSGGQKQRISIARALMKNAPILILDDSVSAVDVKTEKAILENLRTTRAGKTTILIAHRVSTVEQMDKIIFVDEGRISACGSYSELLTTCPPFKTLVDLQKLDDADGGNHSANRKEVE